MHVRVGSPNAENRVSKLTSDHVKPENNPMGQFPFTLCCPKLRKVVVTLGELWHYAWPAKETLQSFKLCSYSIQ